MLLDVFAVALQDQLKVILLTPEATMQILAIMIALMATLTTPMAMEK